MPLMMALITSLGLPGRGGREPDRHAARRLLQRRGLRGDAALGGQGDTAGADRPAAAVQGELKQN